MNENTGKYLMPGTGRKYTYTLNNNKLTRLNGKILKPRVKRLENTNRLVMKNNSVPKKFPRLRWIKMSNTPRYEAIGPGNVHYTMYPNRIIIRN